MESPCLRRRVRLEQVVAASVFSRSSESCFVSRGFRGSKVPKRNVGKEHEDPDRPVSTFYLLWESLRETKFDFCQVYFAFYFV
ncbi:hypothetical protein XELAEV_18008538mg [Xenopus laevis]|uniref:Uncharacterized protein n=1 Tax=Xenopus laevis TaxID=8355 RepID=A0A974I5G5_XENLA|nr:hypothetical protein XELAEV_18008538mg [Xenopus laevis]